MNAEQIAAQSLSKLLNMLKGLTENRDDLLKLGSIKAAIADAQARHDAIIGEQEAVILRPIETITAAEQVKCEAVEALRTAETEGKNIIAQAQARADELVAAATREADELRAAARAARDEAMQISKKMEAAFVAIQATQT